MLANKSIIAIIFWSLFVTLSLANAVASYSASAKYEDKIIFVGRSVVNLLLAFGVLTWF